MKTLYPPIEPRALHTLANEPPHRVYVEDCGNPAGLPVMFLHGGPGSGCKPYHRQFFDPDRYRIVLFDQRGAGRSEPRGEVSGNTTQDLLADMERIRVLLGVERWVVFGGSWGATLALLYAQAHPERVLGLILRGTFLARDRDAAWFFADGANRIFPDHWEALLAAIPDAERHDLVGAFHRRVTGGEDAGRRAAAKAWSDWAGRVVTYTLPSGDAAPAETDLVPDTVVQDVTIELHYATHRYFLEPNQILAGIHRVPAVPVTLIHGRRDLTCTLEASWAVHRALPGSELVVLPDSGHLANEPAMIDALVTATDRYAEILR